MENNYFEEFEEMEAEKGMTVVACYPGKTAQVIEIDGSLESMQQFVGGYIEAVYPFDDPVAIICNEEGKLNGLPLNRALYNEDGEMFDIAHGNIIICGLGEEDFTSLSEDMVQKYKRMFAQPEVFLQTQSSLLILPYAMDEFSSRDDGDLER